MRSRSFISLRNNGFDGQFNNLNNNDMNNLRGGGYPPPPSPKPGPDFPLSPFKSSIIFTPYTVLQPIPVLIAL